MTANELLAYELGRSGNQIEACLNGMSDAAYETKSWAGGMTPKEIVEHLCEAYCAVPKIAQGEHHEWGTYRIEDKSIENLKATLHDLRTKAVATALSSDDEAVLKSGYDYIVGHDNYHVGQLVSARLQAEPDWDSYTIYS